MAQNKRKSLGSRSKTEISSFHLLHLLEKKTKTKIIIICTGIYTANIYLFNV